MKQKTIGLFAATCLMSMAAVALAENGPAMEAKPQAAMNKGAAMEKAPASDSAMDKMMMKKEATKKMPPAKKKEAPMKKDNMAQESMPQKM